MNNDPSPAVAQSAGSVRPSVADAFGVMLHPNRMIPLLALVAIVALSTGLILWTMKPRMVPLLPQLPQQDVAEVIEYLDSRSEPFSVDPTTGLMLVAADRLQQLQIELAGHGLPSGSAMGLELLQQDQSLGTSQFIEMARYQHALETELSRTVSHMRNVDSARVHLALPKRSVFVRQQPVASASVMVKMRSGRTLETTQVAAIVGLVGASVPYLENSQVTVVDQWGRLLSSAGEPGPGQDSTRQFEYTRKLEAHYASRIENMLTPLTGEGRVRASVSVVVDFSVNEQTQETYDADPAQVRSEQRLEQSGGTAGAASGVPGALSNQPPEGESGGESVSVPTGGGRGGNSQNLTRNYELDKTVTHVRRSPGAVRRLSAAVIVDNINSIDESGQSISRAPTELELEQYTALVRESIGYDAERGDTVAVLNQPFQPAAEIAPPTQPPLWQQMWVWNLVRQVMVGLFILALLYFIARPAWIRLLPQLAIPRADDPRSSVATEDLPVDAEKVTLSNEARVGARVEAFGVDRAYGDILLMARAMARDDPKRVARVVKDWVAVEGGK